MRRFSKDIQVRGLVVGAMSFSAAEDGADTFEGQGAHGTVIGFAFDASGRTLSPVVAAMARELLQGDYIQADEIPVGVHMHDGRGKNRQAYLWQYSHRPGRWCSTSALGVKGKDPNASLEIPKGSSKATALAAYDRVGGTGIVHAGCWAHARRKFFDAVKLNPKDQTAIGILESWRRWTNFLPSMLKLGLRN